MSNIAIISYSGIGNLVHWTPCIQALKLLGHNIYVFTWDRCKNIIDDLVTWKWIDGISYDMAQTAWSEITFDYLLVPAVGAHVTPNITKRTIEILKQQISVWGKHESEYMMDFAHKLGYKGEMPRPLIYISPECNGVAEPIFRQKQYDEFIAINASYLQDHNWPLKHWGNSNYHDLIQKINEELKLPCVLIGAQSDFANAANILCNTDNMNTNICGISDDIQETLYVMAQSMFVIGNDGGLQHLANAIHTATITIFTFTNPIKNRPLGPKAKIIMTDCDKRITCQHGYWRECSHRNCNKVSVETVWAKVQQTYQEELWP